MIDVWDIEKLKDWLRLARTEGTDRIKIVVGDEPCTWKVTVLPRAKQAGLGLELSKRSSTTAEDKR